MADDTLANFPKNAPNALQFRRGVSDPESDTAVLPVPPKKTGVGFMRGLQRLANLAPTIMAAIDKEADATADQLVLQQNRALATVGQFKALADTLGKVADDVSAQLGQITNDPTQVSGA